MNVVRFPSCDGRDRRRRFVQDWQACLAAAQRFMPHLRVEQIAHPRHGHFDALLARQIAVHVMKRKLGWPAKRMAREFGRCKSKVFHALHSVDERLKSDAFQNAYDRAFAGSPTGQERRAHG